MKKNALNLCSDLYSRNYIISEGIKTYKKDRKLEKVKILDIGGRNGKLELFLDPADNLTLLDIRDGDEPNLIVGDATNMHMFKDNSFDIITSGDVFEHIAPSKRKKFLEECLRVSKGLVIIAAPFDSPEVRKSEKITSKFFKDLTDKEHEWLKEHVENGLPDKDGLIGLLEQKSLFFQEFVSNDLENWELLQLFAFYAYKFGIPEDLVLKFYSLYNENLTTCENPNVNFYRHVFFITQNSTFSFDFTYKYNPLKKRELQYEAFNVLSQFINIDREKTGQHIQNITASLGEQITHVQNLQTAVGEKDEIMVNLNLKVVEQVEVIKDKDVHIKNLDSSLEEKDEIMKSLNLKVVEQVEVIEEKDGIMESLDLKVVEQVKVIEEKDEIMESLDKMIRDKDRHIENIEPAWRAWKAFQKKKIYKILLLNKRILQKLLHILRRIKIFFIHMYLGLKILFRKGPIVFFKRLVLYTKGINSDPLRQYAYQKFLARAKDAAPSISNVKKEIQTFKLSPKISIIVPVYNVEPKWLNKCIKSITKQYYENWELCLHDDASTNQDTIKCLRKWKKKDPRIKVQFGEKNQHISGASNDALKLASGDFIGLLDHDDELTLDALYEVVKALNNKPELDFIYSDEDKISVDDVLTGPYFKSDFNIDLFLCHNYISHFSVIRKSLGDKVGWFRKGYEGSQDYDLFLRIIDKTEKIHHIPKVLYHWRTIAGSTSSEYDEKSYCHTTSIKALEDYLKRNKIEGSIKKGLAKGTFKVDRKIIKEELVSIIVPFKDTPDLIEQLLKSLKNTTYKNYELLLVSNNSKDESVFSIIKEYQKNDTRIKLLEYNVPFNFSQINNWAVRKAKGDYLLLLNNDIQVIEPEWLKEMMSHIQRDEVGAVGAKLLYPNNTLQHAGIIAGLGGIAGHSHKHLPDKAAGYFFRPHLIQDLSGCTAACLLTKRAVYNKVGGLNEKKLKIAFNDVDFCLKIRKAGYLIVYTPYAKLYHHESVSRGYEDTPEKQERFQRECEYMYKTWGKALKDPYYNVNLSLAYEDFRLDV